MQRIIQGSISVFAAVALFAPAQIASAESTQNDLAVKPLQPLFVVNNGLFLEVRNSLPLSRNEEAALRPMDHFKECESCPEMIVVPAGRFIMGASENEPGSTSDERPRHQVTFSQSFSAGRFAVTFDEWDACFAAGGCSYQPSDQMWGRGKQPVIGILWDDAKQYVEWLSRKTGRPYRLLSEAEREYVTRAGTSSAYWWGDAFMPLQANSDRQTRNPSSPIDDQQRMDSRTVPVDSFAPNPWGFFQVHGNVYDWVEDCGNDSYENAPSDGSAWTEGNCDVHVLRGGAVSRRPETLRSAARIWSGGANRLIYMSVRVARTLKR